MLPLSEIFLTSSLSSIFSARLTTTTEFLQVTLIPAFSKLTSLITCITCQRLSTTVKVKSEVVEAQNDTKHTILILLSHIYRNEFHCSHKNTISGRARIYLCFVHWLTMLATRPAPGTEKTLHVIRVNGYMNDWANDWMNEQKNNEPREQSRKGLGAILDTPES